MLRRNVAELLTSSDMQVIVAHGDPHAIELVADGATRFRDFPLSLTRRGDLGTKLAAFDYGADDVLTVPFSPEELLARVVVSMRRRYGEVPPLRPTITVGELEIDIANRHVRAGTSDLHLTPLEMNLLYLLAANAGRVIDRTEILDVLWGTDYIAEKQHDRSAHPGATRQAAERLAKAALHCHRLWTG